MSSAINNNRSGNDRRANKLLQEMLQNEELNAEIIINHCGLGRYQVLMFLLGGLLITSGAMAIMVVGILSGLMRCEWGLAPFQLAFMTMTFFVGWFFGSVTIGAICDSFGRRFALLFYTFFVCWFCTLSAMSPTYNWLVAMRTCVAFFCGGTSHVYTYYSEIMPTAYRAKCNVVAEAWFALGGILITLAAALRLPWQWILFVAGVPSLVCFICVYFWIRETPRFLTAQGRFEEAAVNLIHIAKMNGCTLDSACLRKLAITPESSNANTTYDSFEMSSTNHQTVAVVQQKVAAIEKSKPSRSRLQILLCDMARTTFCLWYIWVASAFTYYGIILLSEIVLASKNWCGLSGDTEVNATSMFSSDATCDLANFKCGKMTSMEYVVLAFSNAAELPGLFAMLFLVDTVGRRWTIALSFLLYSVCTLALLGCLSPLLLTIVLYVGRAGTTAAFQGAYVYTPEIFPTLLRSVGLGSCSSVGRIGSMVTPFVAQMLTPYSPPLSILVYAGVGIVAAVVAVIGLNVETKGRVLKDY